MDGMDVVPCINDFVKLNRAMAISCSRSETRPEKPKAKKAAKAKKAKKFVTEDDVMAMFG